MAKCAKSWESEWKFVKVGESAQKCTKMHKKMHKSVPKAEKVWHKSVLKAEKVHKSAPKAEKD